MFTYMRYKRDFIKDFEEENIAAWLKNERKILIDNAEVFSWRNSIPYIYAVLKDERIPDNVLVGFEYGLDNEIGNRVDVMIGGYNQYGRRTIIAIELKQWGMLGVSNGHLVNRYLRRDGCIGEENARNPMEQVSRYCEIIRNNQNADKFEVKPVVYLHNMDEEACSEEVLQLLDGGNVFFAGQVKKLSDYIASEMKKTSQKEKNDVFYVLRQGKNYSHIKFHKSFKKIMRGEMEVSLWREQKECYERINSYINEFLEDGNSSTCYVEGGPGSGKTVIAFLLLKKYADTDGLDIEYCITNRAMKLTYGEYVKYYDENVFQTENGRKKIIIVDELHRMRQKHAELLQSIDDDIMVIAFCDKKQRVSKNDINLDELDLTRHIKLQSQFRCSKDEGYLSWIEKVLNMNGEDYLRNFSFKRTDLDFPVEIIPNATALKEMMKNKNTMTVVGPSFLPDVNGYVRICGKKYKKWKAVEGAFVDSPHRGNETFVGDVFDVQGVESDHVIVIIGKELDYSRERGVYLHIDENDETDYKVIKRMGFTRSDFQNEVDEMEEMVKNTYRILLTRGLKSCSIFCCNRELRDYMLNY